MAKLTSLVLIFSLLTAIVLLSSCPAMSQEVGNDQSFFLVALLLICSSYNYFLVINSKLYM